MSMNGQIDGYDALNMMSSPGLHNLLDSRSDLHKQTTLYSDLFDQSNHRYKLVSFSECRRLDLCATGILRKLVAQRINITRKILMVDIHQQLSVKEQHNAHV